MNNLLSEIDKEFDEEFCYQNGIDQMIVRYALCQNPKELREDLQIFIHQAVKRAYEEGKKEMILIMMTNGGLTDVEMANLLSELNKKEG